VISTRRVGVLDRDCPNSGHNPFCPCSQYRDADFTVGPKPGDFLDRRLEAKVAFPISFRVTALGLGNPVWHDKSLQTFLCVRTKRSHNEQEEGPLRLIRHLFVLGIHFRLVDASGLRRNEIHSLDGLLTWA
jgi:hypothetical protein